jgi:hypothetical protein
MTFVPVAAGAITLTRKAYLGRTWVVGTMLLAPLALLWGCAGLVSGNSAQTSNPAPQMYGISGTINPTTAGSGATVSLNGASSATTTAASSGAYTFTGLANGAYVIAPDHPGYAFTPGTQSVTVSGANVAGVNFTATPQPTHSVVLTWNASPTPTVTGYNVYRSSVSGSLYARVNTALVAGLAYTDAAVQNSTTIYFVTTAVDANGAESIFSNEVSAVIP